MHEISENLVLREATPTDQGFLERLYRSVREDLTQLGDDPAIMALITMQQKIHDAGQRSHYPEARHLLLWEDGEAIARAVLDTNAQRLYLVDITVLSSLQSQGIGTSILRWAQQQAEHARLPLELQVQRHNVRALRLYLALGFTEIASNEVSLYLRWEARKYE